MVDLDDLIRTDYKAVDKRDTLSSVLGWMRGDTDKVPIVTDAGYPFGLVNERAFMQRGINHSAKLDTGYVLTTRALPPTASPAEAMARMAEFKAAHLPVEKDGKLAGFVSAIDLARQADWEASAHTLSVPVRALRATDTIGDAIHLFHQEYVDHLPVLDKDGRLAGVLKRQDVVELELNQADTKGRKDAGGEKITPLRDPVDGYLDQVIRISADATKDEVLDKLEAFGYALVEARDGRVVGIVTPRTLAQNAPR